MPNITGEYLTDDYTAWTYNLLPSGCFSYTETSIKRTIDDGTDAPHWTTYLLKFTASSSNSTYGNSTTVTPLSQKVSFYLKF